MIKKFMLYDPDVNGNAGGAPAPVVNEPIKFSQDNPPKSKDDWDKLSKEDPQTWISLTQQNTDRMFRENKELKERLDRESQEKQNLALEVNRYKGAQPVTDPNGKVPFSDKNFPKTQEEWDGLFLENPTFASDLRFNYLNKQTSINTDFNRARSDYAKEVQGEHPDMYLTELDATGSPVKDDKGNAVFKRDQSGLPIFNGNSEKGKLWNQIYQESYRSDGTNALDGAPNAPRLMMAELERRLVKKGQSVIQAAEQNRQNQVAVPGVPPPVSAKVSFKTKEEEAHADLAIQRGVYKSKEEYCQLRDNDVRGVYDTNRRPDFSKK